MDIEAAKQLISSLDADNKYDTMIKTAGIITKMLEVYRIKPIVVGGLSVEIYTQSSYTTRDIDFVSEGIEIIRKVLLSLDFVEEGRHYFRKDKEVAIEIPDNYLEGSLDKVIKVDIDDKLYIYLISLEDIIIDRLRASIYWKSEDDGVWGFTLLANNFKDVDVNYIKKTLTIQDELDEFDIWLNSFYNKNQ